MANPFDPGVEIPRGNFTAVNIAVASGVYNIVAPPNHRRRWMFIQAGPLNAGDVFIILSDVRPGTTSPRITISPRGHCILSMTGDMPWQGGVYVLGTAPDDVWGVEVSDWPGRA